MKFQTAQRLMLVFLAVASCGVLSQREADSTASPLPPKVLPGDEGQVCADRTGVQGEITREVRQLLAGTTVCSSKETKVGSCNCQCGREGGIWRNIAFLNMSDSTMTCPRLGAWEEVSTPVRSCRRSTADGCSSAFFPNDGGQYSRVCGRIIGHQYNTPDSFGDRDSSVTIDDNYLDGVSVTRASPRQLFCCQLRRQSG